MKFKNIFCVFLIAIMCFSFSACKENTVPLSSDDSQENNNSAATRDYITLLYSESDGFNPYTAKTDINRHICKLLYEPLVKLDNEYNPINYIADKITYGDKSCIVSLKTKVFSDGTAIKANDIVYSYNLAKNSASSYSLKLYNVVSCTENADGSVVFKLYKNDPYFSNLLTFPIIKSQSDKITDTDSVLQPPIGSGKFKVNKEQDGLELNTISFDKKSNIKFIKLINAPDIESVTHYAQIGAADMYYTDISDGNITRMSGKRTDINLNSLVYIGVNQNYGQLNSKEFRSILSTGIDREKICKNAFFNNAVAANGFFNPFWSEVKSVQNIQINANKELTIENLERIGYNKLDSVGNRINSNGNSISLTLLVNSENRMRVVLANMLVSQFSEYGIKVSVIEKPYVQYVEALNNNDFQLYLGEVKLTENMDISYMLTEGSHLAFGLPTLENEVDSAEKENTEITEPEIQDTIIKNPYEVINGFYEGENSITDIATVLQSEMPFIPICYRTASLFYNDNIENVINSSECDIYFSIESYICNK